MSLVKEFREFALKGNVIDMAVGLITGAAFGGIVKSLIDDMIMPIVGIAGKADFSNWYVALTPKVQEAIDKATTTGTTLPLQKVRELGLGPVLAYGSFITVVINFVILAGCVFLMIKAINSARRKFERDKVATPPEAPADVKLLAEIRDLLKAKVS